MPLQIKGEVTHQVSSYKFSRVSIEDRLQWADHVKTSKSKINKRMYFLRKLTKLDVDKTLIILQSVLSFSISASGGN